MHDRNKYDGKTYKHYCEIFGRVTKRNKRHKARLCAAERRRELGS
jgi:hypothetical protein